MSEKSNKASEISFVSTLAEASFLLRRVAEPRPAGDSVKAALSRAWRRLPGWSFNRIRDVWHGDQRIRISADELAQLRRAERERRDGDARTAIREARELIARLERLQNTVRLQHPNLDSQELSEVLGTARGPNSTLGE
jgi:hypothetical protein